MRVGLIGSPERKEIQRLAIRLDERGAEAVVFDPRGEPRIELTPTSETLDGADLARFSAFYVADLALPGVRTAADGSADEASLRASQRRLVGWNTLFARLGKRCRVVNPPSTWELHGLKPFENSVHHRLGLRAPWTLATSDPAALLELRRDREAWIAKGMVGGYSYTTEYAPPADLGEARAHLAEAPRMVQERINGENLRVYVVEGRALGAAEIIPASPHEVDSRRETLRVRRVTLPDEARRTALAASSHFGFAFAAVDFLRDTRSGEWWLLECNSAPFFVDYESTSGIDVSSALADLLTSRSRKPALQDA
jgi:glutathione synthase/RimK-type ligase-like ATP-grasp enzyme